MILFGSMIHNVRVSFGDLEYTQVYPCSWTTQELISIGKVAYIQLCLTWHFGFWSLSETELFCPHSFDVYFDFPNWGKSPSCFHRNRLTSNMDRLMCAAHRHGLQTFPDRPSNMGWYSTSHGSRWRSMAPEVTALENADVYPNANNLSSSECADNAQ